MSEPRTETVPVSTPQGVEHKERLTQDERDRALIREGLSGQGARATDARGLIHALARAGEITDANFPLRAYVRLDGVEVYARDEDDAFMAGERPLVMPKDESTTRGMIDWIMRKAVLDSRVQRRSYDPEDAAAFDEYDALAGGLREWYDKFLEAHQMSEDQPEERIKLEEDALAELKERLRTF